MSRVLMTIVKTFAYGSNRMMLQYASALKEAGHDVTIAYEQPPLPKTAGNESILPSIERAGIPTLHVPSLSRSAIVPGGGTLAKVVDQQQFDVLISNQLRDAAATMTVAKARRLPGVAFVQGMPYFQGAGPIRAAKRLVYGRAMRNNATRCICVSPAVQTCLIEDFKVDPEKCVVVPNGIDLSTFSMPDGTELSSVRSEFRVRDEEFLLLTIGRFDRVKGLDILIRAIHQAVSKHDLRIRVLIAAQANSKQTHAYREHLESIVRDHQLTNSVSFIGYRNDCHRLLQGSDGFVLPSRSEGFPLSVLEAFAAECPVIMTDFAKRIPGFRDREHGLSVLVENVEDLANAVIEMASLSQAQRRELAANGRAYLDRHPTLEESSHAFVREIESLIENPVDPHHNRTRVVAQAVADSRSAF
ncbi:MAG: glycosyltransferase family 4 protein [Planctomycetaceae bacterium]|nr:glycosyltransferase family 4 protein [Planctomycetaceae bacterium]